MKQKSVFISAFCILFFYVSIAAAANSPQNSSFFDIQDHWAKTTVDTMASIKVFEGYPDGNFYPDKPLTRAEFLASLNRAVDKGLILQYPEASKAAVMFKDVKPSDWFWGDVKKAIDHGWIAVSDIGQALDPNAPIPRKEMARIMVKVASQMTVDLPKQDPKIFSDVGQSNPYFTDIDAATRLGVLGGYPDGTFKPDGTLTRAEASTVILRILQLDAPKSPYASGKFKGAWEPAKTADMFIFAGWEEAFTQKGASLDLSSFRSFASEKAIAQYQSYLEFVKKLNGIDPSNYGFWMGDFYPKYINNNLAIASWYLSFDLKIGDKWYTQKTSPFTITIRKGSDHRWVVDDFPIQIPKTDQRDWFSTSPTINQDLSFQYKDSNGLYYGNVVAGSATNPQQSDASLQLNQIFSQSLGQIKVLRILGMPAEETINASLVTQLESSHTPKQRQKGEHQLVVSRTGNWFNFVEGSADKILTELWGDFNYNGGQFIPISIDGIAWTVMSDDSFWRKLQSYESSEKIKEDGTQLSQELKLILQKYEK